MSDTSPPPYGGVRQIVVHPADWAAIEFWLAARGITLARMPTEADDLPTYVMVTTTQEAPRP